MNVNYRLQIIVVWAVLTTFGVTCLPAFAEQTEEKQKVEDMVVTATRSEEKCQRDTGQGRSRRCAGD